MRQDDKPSTSLHVVLVVLGDLGRSPRMLYHAQSLLREGHQVTLIGYSGEELMNLSSASSSSSTKAEANAKNNNLTIIRLCIPEARFLQRRGLLPFYFLWRILSLSLCLLFTLYLRLPSAADVLLIQNPPAIPLLLISLLYCKLTTTKTTRTGLVVDWHNVGYSMLDEHSASRTTRLARNITKQYEQYLAKFATAHLCVTKAMQEFLQCEMQIKSTVLYDCPVFEPFALSEQHGVLQRLHAQLAQACPKSWTKDLNTPYKTLLTEEDDDNVIRIRPKRPWLLVSSTSWTADEDFDLLLEALVQLDQAIVANYMAIDVKVLVLITGKGPLREHYEQVVSQLSPPLQYVCIQTIWLSASDYPKLISCCDLGLSLHTSTSGLDLPIKIQDCFGCGIPVLAKEFKCLPEILVDKVHGRVFNCAAELSIQLMELLVSEGGPEALTQYRQAVLKDRPRWHENWVKHGLPVIEAAASRAAKIR